MKILDCFGFCGENEILEIRLETLFEYVDKFIIIEGNKFFNGVSKKKLFNIENFKKYKSKIRYFFIENFPEHNGNNWIYENYQRNQIKLGLNNLNPNDLILISDVDEIPNLENKKFMNFDSTVFLQDMYYYKFNIHLSKGLKWKNKWAGTKSCKFKFFKTAQNVREFRVKNYPWWRFDRKIKRYIEFNGGWHFSFLMDPQSISKKISINTQELDHVLETKKYNISDFNNEKLINERIEKMIDVYDRQTISLKRVDIDESYPRAIRENKIKYKKWII